MGPVWGWEEVFSDESRRSLRTDAMTEMRTNPPFARAAIADAAFLRICGGFFSASQKLSRDRTLKPAQATGFQTVLSLRVTSTIKTRDKTDLGFSTFAGAVSLRIRIGPFVASQRTSPNRSFAIVDFSRTETAISLRHGRKSKERDQPAFCTCSYC